MSISNSNDVDELKMWVCAMYEMFEESSGTKVERKDLWILDSQSLLKKVIFNALSVLDLCEGTKPQIPKIATQINFIDYLSIAAITRSALENYLVFYYIFMDISAGKREKKIRHKLWHCSSLSQRQRQSVLTDGIAKLLKDEKKTYFRMRRQILCSKTFQSKIVLPEFKKLDQKKPFDWKPVEGWRGIAKHSQLSEYYWVDIYNFLSSLVHSNAVISFHFNNSDQKATQENIAYTSLKVLNLILPLFLDGFATVSPRAEEYLSKQSDLIFKIEIAKAVVKSYKPEK